MVSALGLPQAAGPPAPLRLLEAGEAFGLVEVKVLVADDALEAQEVLDASHLPRRVSHQPLATDKQEMREWEVPKPALQVLGVQADPHGAPGRVDGVQTGGVAEGQALKGGQPRVFGQSLGVVGDSPGHRVPHHHDEFGVTVHGAQPQRRLFGHKVAGCLFHSHLSFQSAGHQVSVEREMVGVSNDVFTSEFITSDQTV